MSRARRTGVVVAAAAVLIAMFVAFRPEEEDEPGRTPAASATPATSGDTGTRESPEAEPRRPPPPPLLRAGRTRKLVHQKGDTVRFRVRSSAAEELHVHGYEIVRSLPAGRTVTLRFPARLEGIFEIELHRSHDVVGTLEVRP